MNSVGELIMRRFSCRKYLKRPVDQDTQERLQAFLAEQKPGPFGSPVRFGLIAATAEDCQSLKGLRTYGVIRGAQGFIVGAMGLGPKNLEDFGYLMEAAILYATSLGLGTCWLGGTFSKSSFARTIKVNAEETVPAVTAVGYTAGANDSLRPIGSRNRLSPDKLFYQDAFDVPLPIDQTGAYAQVLESVRCAPSASNKQPWRIVRLDQNWHFYLRRTKGYGKDSLMGKLLGIADLQRVDLGIAMCHFELAARELGLGGHWAIAEPQLDKQDELTEYTASWIAEAQ